ncbi:hypothetical protein Bphyt_3515 [Paraburkholderia phytofirmans PsJN]|uniref:Uncharacterized protein n=1 Tax=Paraburkholderia phytofirmans (strain DSM 17436 / LMG 22146 / PsJN) TaxID=398527 RepID=B2SZ20_PARPJ|nr:hypothetical protein Bphyt_3515 [Paraburkholderia phytofirmans PsJN]
MAMFQLLERRRLAAQTWLAAQTHLAVNRVSGRAHALRAMA